VLEVQAFDLCVSLDSSVKGNEFVMIFGLNFLVRVCTGFSFFFLLLPEDILYSLHSKL
jgi:hypothetical protein